MSGEARRHYNSGVEIYLMRHGIPAGGAGISDRERPLSSEGLAETERAAAGLAATGVRFDRIVTSPLVRAAQTAALMARAQPSPVEPEEREELAGGVVPEILYRALGRVPAGARLLLVGHEPDMSVLAAALIGGLAERPLRFGCGTIVRIDVDGLPPRDHGTLVWLLTAHLAGALAEPAGE
jgi:phosphohistidine phosphatase